MDYLIKNAHFIFIHFPIALLLCSLLFDVAAKLWKKQELHLAGLLTLVLGTLGAIASVITGPEEERNPLIHQHELFGELTMVLAIVLTVVRVGWMLWKKRDPGRTPVYLAGILVAALLVTYTGHLGGQMVHKPRPMNFQRSAS